MQGKASKFSVQELKLSLVRLRKRFQGIYYRSGYIPYNVLVQKKTPIIIYTMGKVGSTALYSSLPQECFFIQIHTLNPQIMANTEIEFPDRIPDVAEHAKQVKRWIVERKHYAHYITMVREPIARNISDFFQNFEFYVGEALESTALSMDKIQQIFFSDFWHDRPLSFFDEEIKEILGTNVFDSPFDPEIGYAEYAGDNYKLLLLRSELDDDRKSEVIAKYLNLPNFKMQRVGQGQYNNPTHGDIYRKFKDSIVLPREYIDQMLNSQYMQHFYTQEERNAVDQFWSARL